MSNDLYKALKEGVVTVEFIKIDTGELRVMPCTLNKDIHKQKPVSYTHLTLPTSDLV